MLHHWYDRTETWLGMPMAIQPKVLQWTCEKLLADLDEMKRNIRSWFVLQLDTHSSTCLTSTWFKHAFRRREFLEPCRTLSLTSSNPNLFTAALSLIRKQPSVNCLLRSLEPWYSNARDRSKAERMYELQVAATPMRREQNECIKGAVSGTFSTNAHSLHALDVIPSPIPYAF